jgi:hypothetical protein
MSTHKDDKREVREGRDVVTPQVATKAEATTGLTECMKRWPVTEGFLSKTVEYVAAGV